MYFIAQVYFIPHGGKGTDMMIESFPLAVFSTILHNIPFFSGRKRCRSTPRSTRSVWFGRNSNEEPVAELSRKTSGWKSGCRSWGGRITNWPRRQSTALPSTSGRKGTAGDSGRPPAAGHGSCRRPAGQHANQTVGRGNIRSASWLVTIWLR